MVIFFQAPWLQSLNQPEEMEVIGSNGQVAGV